ncbi:hypothetical protein [Pseudomonas sp. HAR-UPW-AIA-41]|uniref:hypothetical protein n=1 Tax=Pseudomonas sp. HAR-UPW-AIA-41 TaxID=1985301 RepID=UPI002114298F|nr:hypothetical protein [Pseudomonas sp. HAR-UPW-AIA-41]
MASHLPPLQLLCLDIPQACRAHDLLDAAGIDCQILSSPNACLLAPHCRAIESAETQRLSHLQQALHDTVATLEKTRHAFKSRDLAELRKRLEVLLQNLSDTAASGKTPVEGSAPA